MRQALASIFLLALTNVTVPSVWADDRADCTQTREAERSILGCTRILKTVRLSREDRATAYYRRGIGYHDKGQYDLAIADFSQAILINRRFTNAYINRGIAYRIKGLVEHALADHDQAILFDPRDASAYFNRGQTYQINGQFDNAIADYNLAIVIDPKYTNAYYNRGVSYGKKDELAKAIADYRKALQIDPSHQLARRNLMALGVTLKTPMWMARVSRH